MTIMPGVLARTALALASTASAVVVAAAPGSTSARVPDSGFGGSEPVSIAHVGHIEVALGPAGAAGLRQVRCAGVAAIAYSCFVGR